jgi:hypothetical protein
LKGYRGFSYTPRGEQHVHRADNKDADAAPTNMINPIARIVDGLAT